VTQDSYLVIYLKYVEFKLQSHQKNKIKIKYVELTIALLSREMLCLNYVLVVTKPDSQRYINGMKE
jgi:hypothetical protein